MATATQNLSILPLTFKELSNEYKDWTQTRDVPLSLMSVIGRTIKIRGFLYKGANDDWILSEEPNLKSCCVGALLKKGSQILIKNASFEENMMRAVTLHGELQIEPTASPYFYILETAIIQEEKGFQSYFPFLTLALCGILLLTYLKFYCAGGGKKM